MMSAPAAFMRASLMAVISSMRRPVGSMSDGRSTMPCSQSAACVAEPAPSRRGAEKSFLT